MKTFSITGASHYCLSFEPKTGDAEKSVQEFRDLRLGNRSSITEGTALFDEYRACALRDTERSLFLAGSHYRRALGLMIPSASHWALVTLYYGAWFAARALLGLFGCVVLSKHVIHVDRSSPGNQRLLIQRLGYGQNYYHVTQRGSHQRFWEIFYQTVPSITPFADPEFSPTLAPVSNNQGWLIEQRNTINYNTVESVMLGRTFGAGFCEGTFPNSLPGVLYTQYAICEGILAVCCRLSSRFGLATDALDALSPPAPIGQRINDLVYNAVVPDLVASTRKHEVFGT